MTTPLNLFATLMLVFSMAAFAAPCPDWDGLYIKQEMKKNPDETIYFTIDLLKIETNNSVLNCKNVTMNYTRYNSDEKLDIFSNNIKIF